ncbi:p21-activated protein kinase-interacting protein 1-like [Chlorella vulgaris]
MALLAGSYERFLFGYQLDGQVEPDAAVEQAEKPGLQRTFTHAAHKGVVKCVATAGQYAATGGADDLIHLFDLKNDKDLGFLMSPGEGAVTALAFFTPAGAYNPTHMLSGSADGSMSVWQAGGGWECMKTLRAHRKEVAAICVHPSGLIALSVGRDSCLRMWDLVKGRCTFTAKLEVEAEAVEFSTEDGGTRYALLCGTRITLHGVQGEEGLLCTLDHPRRALCMAWAPGNKIVSGSEDGSLRLWDAQSGVELLCIGRAHTSRVRTLALLPASSSDGRLLVATGSSDGSIKLWDLTKAAAAGAPSGDGGGSTACLAEVHTRARLTCMAAADLPEAMQQLSQAAAQARSQAAKQQQQAGKRKAEVAAAGPQKKNGKRARAGAQQQQQQQTASQAVAGGGKPKAKPAAAKGQSAPADSVVVHDGVVEFLDAPPKQQQQQQKKQKKKKAQAASQQGKQLAASKPGLAAKGGKRPAA